MRARHHRPVATLDASERAPSAQLWQLLEVAVPARGCELQLALSQTWECD